MRGGTLDVRVFALTCPALRGQHPAAMNVLEGAEWELIAGLRVLGLGVVLAQVPLGDSPHPRLPAELVLFLPRGLVSAPDVAPVVQ